MRAFERQLFKYALFLEQKFTWALSGQHFVGEVWFLDSIAHFTVVEAEDGLSLGVRGQTKTMKPQMELFEAKAPFSKLSC